MESLCTLFSVPISSLPYFVASSSFNVIDFEGDESWFSRAWFLIRPLLSLPCNCYYNFPAIYEVISGKIYYINGIPLFCQKGWCIFRRLFAKKLGKLHMLLQWILSKEWSGMYEKIHGKGGKRRNCILNRVKVIFNLFSGQNLYILCVLDKTIWYFN